MQGGWSSTRRRGAASCRPAGRLVPGPRWRGGLLAATACCPAGAVTRLRAAPGAGRQTGGGRRAGGRSRIGAEAELHCAGGGVGRSGVGAGQRTDGGIGDSALGSGRDRTERERGMDSHLWTSCWALLIWAHMLYRIVYIYEYLLVFSSKSWVCLGIQGHTPSAAPACALCASSPW